MPGEFYIEAKKEKLSLKELVEAVAELEAKLDKLAGQAPMMGSTVAEWNTAEADVVSVGADDTKYKLHSLLISIANLVGTAITVRIYMKINGSECRVYEQIFNAIADPPGLWIVNGTVAIHQVLRLSLQSNEAADNGKVVNYDYMLEEM